MGTTTSLNDQLRQRIRGERERRGWTQANLAEKMTLRGVPAYPSTIAKVETGTRDARVDEVAVIADLFGISFDALAGRSPRDTDLLWAVNKLTANAQKMAGEVGALRLRFIADVEDVRMVADDFRAGDIRDFSVEVAVVLEEASQALSKLAGMFPFPQAAE